MKYDNDDYQMNFDKIDDFAANKHHNSDYQDQDNESPLSIWFWLGVILITNIIQIIIPFIGYIICIITFLIIGMSIKKYGKTFQNFARAVLIIEIISFVIYNFNPKITSIFQFFM